MKYARAHEPNLCRAFDTRIDQVLYLYQIRTKHLGPYSERAFIYEIL